MSLIRPRLTDYHNISTAQAELDFAIPFLAEDIPLYVDPFLLWRSPSHQDQALHTSLISSFNRLNWLSKRGREQDARAALIEASECDEVGLGLSATRKGKRIGNAVADGVLDLFRRVPQYSSEGFIHFEEIQLYADGISKDRVSDIACNFLKSFLIDYTIENCEKHGMPLEKTTLKSLYSYQKGQFELDKEVRLPLNPDNSDPIILVPKRWLRHVPWINYDDYFSSACPRDEVTNAQGSDERVSVLLYNRENYGVVEDYVRAKERSASDCHNDPLFKQIPVLSAKRKFATIKALPSGKADNADMKYEDNVSALMSSILYPHLDFADTQSRSDGGSTIRDLIFYNNSSVEFLKEIKNDYNSRQIVFELKNVKAIEREHINQLNRYLTNELGSFGVLVTRNPLPRAMFKSTVELWSGQRRCIIAITDADLDLMVQLFESKQRDPIDVIKKKYLEFRRACPS
jgi:hypothetical protein